jgi:hypothetical protein
MWNVDIKIIGWNLEFPIGINWNSNSNSNSYLELEFGILGIQ